MKIERKIKFLSILICACLWLTGVTNATSISKAFKVTPSIDQKYKIYCINHKVGIEMMSREELLSAGLEEVCELTKDEYENLDEASESAKRFGGVGAPCSCSPE